MNIHIVYDYIVYIPTYSDFFYQETNKQNFI